ncbi:hypothetical protein DFH28DRAFT_1218169 [Melampsora americana]|nr:hypothetical protein DFH28DRAFT_1218169 [Melampsora americana]
MANNNLNRYPAYHIGPNVLNQYQQSHVNQHRGRNSAFHPGPNNRSLNDQSQYPPPHIRNNVASHLERIVQDQESGLMSQTSTRPPNTPPQPQVVRPNPTPSQPPPIISNPITPTMPPLEEPSQDSTRKRKKQQSKSKSKKTKAVNSSDDPIPILDRYDLQEITNKTAVELRCLASKHATEGANEVTINAILQFHEEMQTTIAIKALELGVSVSVIEEIFGKYIGVRRSSAWNHFLRSEEARVIFKEECGISSGAAMKALSAKWSSMSAEEKRPYKDAAAQKAGTDTSEFEALDQDLESMEFGTQSRKEILQPRTNVVLNARCLKQYKENAERFMDTTIANCVSVAKSNHFAVVIIAVSNHIGKHHFQLTRNTAAIDKQVNYIYDSDGINSFPAQLQAYLLGKTTPDLANDLASRSRRFQSVVVHNLAALLKEATGLEKWPWSNCDKVLSDAGVELRLLPGARSDITTLKTPSARLNHTKVLALDNDLKQNLIQLIKRPNETHSESQVGGNGRFNDVGDDVHSRPSIDPSLL